jgi:glyoxylase-like metal-dependent hydrolase (beta-lactamase superfamily II)
MYIRGYSVLLQFAMSRPYTFQVAQGVYCVMRRSYFTNCYLVDRPDGVVAIDAGMKSNGSEVFAALEEIGRRPENVTAVLLTHWHNDHAAGASALAAVSHAPVFYSAAEADHLTRRAASTGLRAALSAHIPETGPLVLFKGLLGNAPQEAVEASRYIRGGEVVANDFEAIDTPGHTAGHLSYFYRPSGVLFAGDALAVIRGRLRFMARPVTEDLAAARESMLRVLSLPIRWVCPGHREPLVKNVVQECDRLRRYILDGSRWPILG